MDQIDRKLLNIMQNRLPIDKRPFLIIATELGVAEEEVIDRIKSLKKKGYIRRIGGIFNSKSLGYHSILCAAIVPSERIEQVAQYINSFEEITHNYIREHQYNMWFTIIAPSNKRIEEIIETIKRDTEIEDILKLPSVKLFKIKASFDTEAIIK